MPSSERSVGGSAQCIVCGDRNKSHRKIFLFFEASNENFSSSNYTTFLELRARLTFKTSHECPVASSTRQFSGSYTYSMIHLLGIIEFLRFSGFFFSNLVKFPTFYSRYTNPDEGFDTFFCFA